jgi:hypothetical protein
MALLNQERGTLLDLLKLLSDGSPVRRIGELATRDSELLQRMPWMPANGSEGHLVSYQSALPRPTWVKHNQGVRPTKGTTDNYTETFGRAEARVAIAKSLVERNGGDLLKAQQIRMHVLGISQDVVEKTLYSSNAATPEQFMGLIPRLDSLTGQWRNQIVNHNASASGNDQASILLIRPGEDGVHFIYPKGTPAGLDYKKLTDDYEDDGSGGKVMCERGHFVWNVGVAVEDARSIVRIGNIDLSAVSTTAITIVDAMIDACESMRSLDGCFFLMPRRVRGLLRKQKNSKAVPITAETVEGKRQLMFDNVPIITDDCMLLTESPIGA